MEETYTYPTPEPSSEPYETIPPAPEPPTSPRRDNRIWWIVGIVGAFLLFLLCCCCLIAAVVLSNWEQISQWLGGVR